jgi:hypothetical protein
MLMTVLVIMALVVWLKTIFIHKAKMKLIDIELFLSLKQKISYLNIIVYL